MSAYRTEHDSMGKVQVPAQAYYGAQTQRAVENFPISGWPLPSALIRAMGLVKYARGAGQRSIQVRQDDSGALPRERCFARRSVKRSAESDERDRTARLAARRDCHRPIAD
jgi:aspartate ammonia-lyase